MAHSEIECEFRGDRLCAQPDPDEGSEADVDKCYGKRSGRGFDCDVEEFDEGVCVRCSVYDRKGCARCALQSGRSSGAVPGSGWDLAGWVRVYPQGRWEPVGLSGEVFYADAEY